MSTLKRPREHPPTTLPSSSPAFATPLHPITPPNNQRPPIPPPAFKPATTPTILPILLPPPTLRPLAFRTFTKKHNLTLNSSALQALATFIGRHCGSGWREEGTGERVLEESAKIWKAEGGGVMVEDGETLKGILKTLDGCMSGGRVGLVRTGSLASNRQNSFTFAAGRGQEAGVDMLGDGGEKRPSLAAEGRGSSFGMSRLQVESSNIEGGADEEEDTIRDPRAWLKVISASLQPRFSYDMENKHFVPLPNKPLPFPSAKHKTAMFKERYNIIHQRLLRNSAFQTPSFAHQVNTLASRNSTSGQQQEFYKLTPIANLLGRGGSTHLLLGMLNISPTGTLALNDPSGSISLDLQHAQPVQGADSAFYCPGMIVLIDGVYEDDFAGAGSSGLGGTGGVGGMIGGVFRGFSISSPPVERRSISLSIDLRDAEVGGGFGWTDFLGVGSEKAMGGKMRRVERRLLSSAQEEAGGRKKIIVLSEVNLDLPSTLIALRKLLTLYTSSSTPLPLAFLLCGSFTSLPAMSGLTGADAIGYKEIFNALAAVLADFPALLRQCTWIFVPGDNDPWSAAFAAGASSMVPREGVPNIFTGRVMRALANAKAEVGVKKAEGEVEGEAIWTSNPARLSFFGPAHEVVVFRDDVLGRLRRSAVRVGGAVVEGNGHEQNPRAAADEGDDIIMSGAVREAELTTVPVEAPTEDKDDYTTLLAKRTILSLLPQSTLSPFPPTLRPVHWDHATASGALSLYPLPHTLVLADAEQKAWSLVYEGCCVLNPGRFVVGGSGRGAEKMQWVEYDCWNKRGTVRGEWVE